MVLQTGKKGARDESSQKERDHPVHLLRRKGALRYPGIPPLPGIHRGSLPIRGSGPVGPEKGALSLPLRDHGIRLLPRLRVPVNPGINGDITHLISYRAACQSRSPARNAENRNYKRPFLEGGVIKQLRIVGLYRPLESVGPVPLQTRAGRLSPGIPVLQLKT